MRVLLAYQFEVDPSPGQTTRQCLGAIREIVAAWISGHYGRKGTNQLRFPFDGTTLIPKPNHEIRTNQEDGQSHQLTTYEWDYPDIAPRKRKWRANFYQTIKEDPQEEYAPSVWRISCFLACDAQTIQIALVVTVGVEDGMLRRFSTNFGDTNPFCTLQNELLKSLVSGWHCRVEDQGIVPFPIPLTKELLHRFNYRTEVTASRRGKGVLGEQDAKCSDDPLQKFIETVLISQRRRLPVVMLAEDEELVKTIPDAFEFASPEALKKTYAWWLTRPNGDNNDGAKFVNLRSTALQRKCGAMNFPEYLQSRLLGHSQVAVVDSLGAERLAQLLGRNRNVEVPGMRIYWPGFTQNTPSTECPSYGVTELSQLLKQRPVEPIEKSLHHQMTQLSGDCFREGHIIRAARATLAIEGAATRRGIATLTTKLPQIEAEAEEARQARERLRHDRDTLQRQLDTAQKEVAKLRVELLAIRELRSPKKDDELSAELERAWDENHRLQVEIESGRKRVAELAEHLRAAQENLAQLWQFPADLSLAIPSEERSFTSVAAALSAAATEFGDILTVWEEAVRSAEQSLFASPDQVYRALLAIVEVGRDYFSARARGVAAGPLDRAFQKRIPFKYTGFESATTLSMYGADRVFRHGGLSLQMQRHLTLGGGQTNNCLQIFFEFEDINQRVLIGYCGRHLPYAGQRS